MQVLLTTATALEMDAILPVIRPGITLHQAVCGMGALHFGYHLGRALCGLPAPSLVIQAGLAGSFSQHYQPGQVVMVQKDRQADLGAEEFGGFTPMEALDFARAEGERFSYGWLENPGPLPGNGIRPAVTAISANRVSDSQLWREQCVQLYAPDIESMEGAAFHYLCLQEGLPFLQIRGISNFVGERDKSRWKIGEALTGIREVLNRLL